MDGDILGVTVDSSDGQKFFVASFHGDTNGLATTMRPPPSERLIRELEEAQQSRESRLPFSTGKDGPRPLAPIALACWTCLVEYPITVTGPKTC